MLEKFENLSFPAQIFFELSQKNDKEGLKLAPPPRVDRVKIRVV